MGPGPRKGPRSTTPVTLDVLSSSFLNETHVINTYRVSKRSLSQRPSPRGSGSWVVENHLVEVVLDLVRVTGSVSLDFSLRILRLLTDFSTNLREDVTSLRKGRFRGFIELYRPYFPHEKGSNLYLFDF